MSQPDPLITPTVYKLPECYRDSNFWARGAKSKIGAGAESNKLIHIAVGHALSNWEHVESAASILFTLFVESNSIAAARAYGSILGARAREAALREAAEIYFLLRRKGWDESARPAIDTMEECFKILIKNYVEASGRRNDFAHGVAWKLDTSKSAEGSWFLVAPNYQSKRTTNWIEDEIKLLSQKGLKLSDEKARFEYNKIYYKNSAYVFGVTEIKTFAGKFAYLYADLLGFFGVMDPKKMSLKPSQLSNIAKHLS
jgi:hypothetical protein